VWAGIDIHLVPGDIDIHGLGFDPKCNRVVQARSESARENRLDLNLNLTLENLKDLVQYLILLVVAVFLEHDGIHGDSMPVEQSRLAALQVYVPRRFWYARLVEQGKPALSYLRYTMRHVHTYVNK
jgi:hypothetical protein